MRRADRVLAVAVAAVVALSGCRADPETAKRDYMSRGDAYARAGQPREAIIEYRKAAQADPAWADAQRRLARTYLDVNEPANAYQAFARAADLDPGDTASAMSAGSLLLAAGEFERARSLAEAVLARHPQDAEAHILLGHALAGLRRPDAAIRQVQEAIDLEPHGGRAHAALGAIALSQGRRQEAEAAFLEAVRQAPDSRDAHLALGAFYMATGRPADGERAFRRAHALDPRGELTNRALGTLLLASGQTAEAEPFFVTAAEAHPRSRLVLSDYYAAIGKDAQAERVLAALAGKRDLETDVETRRAAILYRAGRRDEAHALLERQLDRGKPPSRALLLQGRFLLTEGKAEQAAQVLARAWSADPGSATAAYALGLAHLARRDLDAAESAFESVVRLNPQAVAARLHLASIALERGESRRAARLTREAAEGSTENVDVQVVAARALRLAGDADGAGALLDSALERHASSPALWVERGALCLDRHDLAGARAAFTRAASLAPGTFEPLAGLTNVDVAAGQTKAARQRLASKVSAPAPDARLLLLAGQVAAADRDLPAAEQLLKRAVAASPDLLDAYAELGRVYVSTGRLDEAKAQFARLAKSQPVVSYTMSGLIAQAQGNPAAARAAYERALDVDPQAAVAANNLAWLLVDSGGDLDRARDLATAAHHRMPERPEMNDTLGWVLHLAGDHDRALTYLQRAVRLNPRNALYYSHLGLALRAQGDVREARASLERALAIDAGFRGHEEARRVLSAMAQE